MVKWNKDKEKCPFPPREGQATAVIGSKLYVFGGVVFLKNENGGGEDLESNDLLVYDVLTRKWFKEPCYGTWPSPRSGATMTSVGKSLYLFGGLSQFSGWMNDFYRYDTECKTWKCIDASGAPSPRDKVMCASVGEKIYIHGGFGPAQYLNVDPDDVLPIDDDDGEYEDMDELHEVRNCQEAANFTWSDELHVFCTSMGKWSHIKPKGPKIPSARAAHSLTAVSSKAGNWLYVFGGRDIDSRQNDLWRFNIKDCVWDQCQGLGCQPQPRSFHAAVAVKGRLVVHGGRAVNNQHFDDFNIFDIDTKEWLQPEMVVGGPAMEESIETPCAMGLHTLCAVDNYLILFGGSSELDPATGTCTKYNNDIFRININDILEGGAIAENDSSENDAKQTNVSHMPGILNLKAKVKSSDQNSE
ncbi:unnamed protein product [Clavelina lepadiformis]|uniref:Uncharacterized protein n=1 Tax=Clavelina lepadiformis TaxID=159417 RepID=A0ABP0GHL0_CLALP